MPPLRSLKYRTFDSLLGEVAIDLQSYNAESTIEPAELIKIAQRCNSLLGLKINGTKETILDIEHGRAKLPADFYQANLALLCDHNSYTTLSPFSGLQSENTVIYNNNPQPNITSCPCWTVVSYGATVEVTACDGTKSNVTFPANSDGSPVTSKICAMNVPSVTGGTQVTGCRCYTITTTGGWFEYNVTYCDNSQGTLRVNADTTISFCGLSAVPPTVSDSEAAHGGPASSQQVIYGNNCYQSGSVYSCASNGNALTATTNSYCYNDPNTGTYSCTVPQSTCCDTVVDNTCSTPNPDPWFRNKVYTLCNGTVGVKVVEKCQYETREYTNFSKVYFEPAREATAFCLNTRFPDAPYHAQIKNGFIYINNDTCRMYLCYQGALEDEDGNLLVLDDPMINLWYEWELKVRVLSNLYINGEPDIERRLQYAEKECKRARIEAMNKVATPDFMELMSVVNKDRSNIYNQYIHPFERQFGDWSEYGAWYKYGRY